MDRNANDADAVAKLHAIKMFFSISTFNWTPCTERNKATNAITNHRVDWELKMMWIVAGECVIPTAAPRRVDNSRPPFSKKWWIIPWKWAKCIDPLFYILNNSILNGIENKEDERDVRRVVAVHTTSGPKGKGTESFSSVQKNGCSSLRRHYFFFFFYASKERDWVWRLLEMGENPKGKC